MSSSCPAIEYPKTRHSDDVDDYHGQKITDPFRWLEDDRSAETHQWVKAQNAVTNTFLDTLPERTRIQKRLEELWNYERFGVPSKKGSRYFFTYNSGLQNHAVVQVADSLSSEARILIDPNKLSEDATVALGSYRTSPDGKLFAYGLAHAGSDWQDWHVRDVASGSDLSDRLDWVKFSTAAWARDCSGFYYSRFDEPKKGETFTGVNEFQKLYFHKLGTKQSDDLLVFESKEHKEWGFGAEVTEDGRFLLIDVSRGTDPKNAIFCKDLSRPESNVDRLLPDFDASYSFIGNDGRTFYFRTDREAPRGKVIALSFDKPAREAWTLVVPESKDSLKSVSYLNGLLICSYLHDAHSVVKIFRPGTLGEAKFVAEVPLPGLGSAWGFDGDQNDKETFFVFTSFNTPGTVYRLDLETFKVEVFREPKVSFDRALYETKQVFYRSKDGTSVPMFIVHRKDLKLDGTAPTRLYGYGGFDISLTPTFSVPVLTWLEMGGVYAMPNLRGGGEYGTEWHLAGTKERKQNVFDDFIAAAEWLIANQYTSSKHLGISGGSNGGLLVGACMTQRPELFAAAVPAVGVMDMLRFHKFTIGWAWTSDYGSSDQPEEFRYLLKYSPLHNLREGVRYPATMIMTADHDDRVVPAHSFKFAARLQESQAKDGPPVLIRIETDAGHGAGTALKKSIEENTDALAFLQAFLFPK